MNNLNRENINIEDIEAVPSPEEITALYPSSLRHRDNVLRSREMVRRVLDGRDQRLLVVVGPCSIHDPDATIEYAQRLERLAAAVSSTLFVVMRVYFMKPRSTVGWKGLINDPYLDGSFRIVDGLKKARHLMHRLVELGIPTATEILDPITPQYMADLFTWSAIGARTAKSQLHLGVASGLSTPVGIKNGTDGSLSEAVNAIRMIAKPHRFFGIDERGACSLIGTKGNAYAHIVLRGGARPNYDAESIGICRRMLLEHGLPANIMVDCSHGNSGKNPARQIQVLQSCVDQILAGDSPIIGVMLESNLEWGSQKIPADLTKLEYGVSVTDACIDWNATEHLLWDIHSRLSGSSGLNRRWAVR